MFAAIRIFHLYTNSACGICERFWTNLSLTSEKSPISRSAATVHSIFYRQVSMIVPSVTNGNFNGNIICNMFQLCWYYFVNIRPKVGLNIERTKQRDWIRTTIYTLRLTISLQDFEFFQGFLLVVVLRTQKLERLSCVESLRGSRNVSVSYDWLSLQGLHGL